MTYHKWKPYFLPFLPSTAPSPFQTLDGHHVSSKAFHLNAYLTSEIHENKDTVRCDALGAVGRRISVRRADANLEFALVQNTPV